MGESTNLTGLINRALDGDSDAGKAAYDIAYESLCGLARQRLNRNARGVTLDTAALVHESFLRFVKSGRMHMNDRQHFLRYASRVMRSVVIDIVRERAAARRGGLMQRVTLTDNISGSAEDSANHVIDVHHALNDLAKRDPAMANIVEMRYFAGMTEQEIAEVLGVSDRTVRRIWQRARIWLADALD